MDGEEEGVVVFEVRLERIDARDDNDDAVGVLLLVVTATSGGGLGEPRKNSSRGGKFCLLELKGLVLFLLLIITLEDEEEGTVPRDVG